MELAAWREDDNHVRPHSALNWRTPLEVGAELRTVDLLDKPKGLPITPQRQQHEKSISCSGLYGGLDVGLPTGPHPRGLF